ncbi:MAG: 3-isopropylmalate dehydratase small subunit [Deltaproteobacteria bacterium]|nr:3-isopropylmalate dehydratase small subunit [Deltaproteobacteria bacterium]
MKNFSGNVLFLDRSDINTDEIIPAKYLTENSKQALKPYFLEDIWLEGFNARRDVEDKNIIITRANFGCGSSREHAPWAIEVNNIHLVIAESFARIFRQNMFNCGMMAVELPARTIDGIFITITADGQHAEIPFSISNFDRALITTGGWVDYADSKY